MNRTIKLLIVAIAIIAYPCYIYFNDDIAIKSTKEPETEIEEVSYSYGVLIASQVMEQGFDSLNVDALAKGCSDILAGNEPYISEDSAMILLNEFFGKIAAKKQANTEKASANYLTENAAKAGVITTASGLQYEVIKSGNGERPSINDQVTVHYHGMLTDGTVFDSSVDRGEPAQFGVTQVIPGWVEALQLMSVGGKWRITIPSELAYGERGAGGMIGPNSTLVFEVELIAIN